MTPEEVWRRKSDEELVAASLQLNDFTDVGQRVIVAELERRRASGLMSHLESENPAPEASDPSRNRDSAVDVPNGMVRRLWRGYVSLPITYWLWGVVGGLFLLIARALAEVTGVAILALLLALLHVVYYVFISIAIWRSAGRYRGNSNWAHLARISVAAGAARVVVNIIASAVGTA